MMIISVVVFMARRLLQRSGAVHLFPADQPVRPLKLRPRMPPNETGYQAGRRGGFNQMSLVQVAQGRG